MHQPYIVSEDVRLLLSRWTYRRCFNMPTLEFYEAWLKKFSAFMTDLFPGFILIREEKVTQELTFLANANRLPTISLDSTYYHGDMRLEIARTVDDVNKDRGIETRPGAAPLNQQLEALQKQGIHEAALVDDVVFSGHHIEWVTGRLAEVGIRVPRVYAAIGIDQGILRIRNNGQYISCVHTFSNVIDEVCMRDFIPGVPFSGRLLAGQGNIGVPYLLPFGRPETWASIPDNKTKEFSRFCLSLAMELWDHIGRESGKIVRCCDLDRSIIGIPPDETPVWKALHCASCRL